MDANQHAETDFREEQVFIDLKPHFNLRQTKEEKPTIIYCVFTFGGRQWKITTGLKVYPSQWMTDKQQALESNQLKRIDNRNNAITNKRIRKITERFSDWVSKSVEGGSTQTLVADIATAIYPMTARKKYCVHAIKNDNQSCISMKASKKQPMIFHLKEVNDKLEKDGRVAKPYITVISVLEKYLKEKGIEDDISNLNLSLLNGFKRWLEEQESQGRLSRSTMIGYEKRLKTLVNNVNEEDSRSGEDYIDVKAFKASKDTRSLSDKQAKSTPLTNDDLIKVEKVLHLNPKQEEARDMFLALCLSGQRVSDLKKILFSPIFVTEGGLDFIHIAQKKIREADAVIAINPRLKAIREKYKDGTKYINLDSSGQRATNKAIREIAEIAGLDTPITYTERGKQITEPYYNVIHNHTGRHTYATILSDCRVPDYIIAYTTGHKEKSKSELSTYQHSQPKQKAQIIAEELANNEKMRQCFIFADPYTKPIQQNISETPKNETIINSLFDCIKQQGVQENNLQQELEELRKKLQVLNNRDRKQAMKELSKIKEIAEEMPDEGLDYVYDELRRRNAQKSLNEVNMRRYIEHKEQMDNIISQTNK